MERAHHHRAVVAVMAVGAALLGGCGSGPGRAAPAPSVPTPVGVPATGAAPTVTGPVPTGTAPTVTGPVPTGTAGAATGGGSGRHGGRDGATGGTASVNGLPPGWPAGLPVPAGVVQGSNSGPGVWVVTVLARGDSNAVRRSVAELYQPRGFRVDPQAYIPMILTGPAYTITVHMAPRDHSAAETDVVVEVRPAS